MPCANDCHKFAVLYGPYKKTLFIRSGIKAGYNSRALAYETYHTLFCEKCGYTIETKINEWVNVDE